MATASPETRPSFADLRALPLLLEREVPESYGDANGHMNVRHYLALNDDAGWGFFARVGIGEDYLTRRQLSFFDSEHHLRYLAELLVGTPVAVHGRLLARSDKALHAQWYVLDLEHDRLANTFEFVTIHVDLTTRRPASIPGDVAGLLDDLLAEHQALPWAAPTSGALGLRR